MSGFPIMPSQEVLKRHFINSGHEAGRSAVQVQDQEIRHLVLNREGMAAVTRDGIGILMDLLQCAGFDITMPYEKIDYKDGQTELWQGREWQE